MSSYSLSDGVPDETPAELLADSLNLIGSTTVAGTAYGVMVTLFVTCVYYLLLGANRRRNGRRTWFYLMYCIIMFILGTLNTAANAWTRQQAFVTHRLFPLGPTAYTNLLFNVPMGIIGTMSYTTALCMADGLILWRFIMLYQDTRYRHYIVPFPCLLYVTSVVMSYNAAIHSSLSNLYSKVTVELATPAYSLTVSLNVLTTSLMVIRLYLHRRHVQEALGREHGSQYTSIAAMLIESSALYAVWSIVFIVLYSLGHPAEYVLLTTLSQVQIIAPLLIIMRVAQGTAWTHSTQQSLLSTMKYRSSSQDKTFRLRRMHTNTDTFSRASASVGPITPDAKHPPPPCYLHNHESVVKDRDSTYTSHY
ncbi:hypothetical protein CONPUDRAFT_142613 [Coniophora puteana RWD-64-598 SS2]|uniref:Uncharacterized protein n=1 Tax=Coniophora puteana (strain RWD-64-598) TaxID=741705 RepID=A0A5M3MYX4_CONPW|nr:uncharacterized protein CONPUDRAFT_142613 [Coniophora puteana RWD-64-598 SS2]EIW84256.1 hypothetical protein CONPUDRAFT_142613 [Coniophora puteana RWD-64-598 SS2]